MLARKRAHNAVGLNDKRKVGRMNGYTVSQTFDGGFAVRIGETGHIVAHEVVTTEKIMDILGVTYSAKIDLSPVTFAQVHTMFYGGWWQWFGYVHEVKSVDELLIKHTRIVGKVESAVGLFWVSSEDALADAVAQFYTEPDGTVRDGTFPDVESAALNGDEYPGDAAEHKAMDE